MAPVFLVAEQINKRPMRCVGIARPLSSKTKANIERNMAKSTGSYSKNSKATAAQKMVKLETAAYKPKARNLHRGMLLMF